MQNILEHTDHLSSKLGPVTQLIDFLAERLVPKASALAIPCVHCTYFCTYPCGRGKIYRSHYAHCCSSCPPFGCSTTYIGCNC